MLGIRALLVVLLTASIGAEDLAWQWISLPSEVTRIGYARASACLVTELAGSSELQCLDLHKGVRRSSISIPAHAPWAAGGYRVVAFDLARNQGLCWDIADATAPLTTFVNPMPKPWACIGMAVDDGGRCLAVCPSVLPTTESVAAFIQVPSGSVNWTEDRLPDGYSRGILRQAEAASVTLGIEPSYVGCWYYPAIDSRTVGWLPFLGYQEPLDGNDGEGRTMWWLPSDRGQAIIGTQLPRINLQVTAEGAIAVITTRSGTPFLHLGSLPEWKISQFPELFSRQAGPNCIPPSLRLIVDPRAGLIVWVPEGKRAVAVAQLPALTTWSLPVDAFVLTMSQDVLAAPGASIELPKEALLDGDELLSISLRQPPPGIQCHAGVLCLNADVVITDPRKVTYECAHPVLGLKRGTMRLLRGRSVEGGKLMPDFKQPDSEHEGTAIRLPAPASQAVLIDALHLLVTCAKAPGYGIIDLRRRALAEWHWESQSVKLVTADGVQPRLKIGNEFFELNPETFADASPSVPSTGVDWCHLEYNVDQWTWVFLENRNLRCNIGKLPAVPGYVPRENANPGHPSDWIIDAEMAGVLVMPTESSALVLRDRRAMETAPIILVDATAQAIPGQPWHRRFRSLPPGLQDWRLDQHPPGMSLNHEGIIWTPTAGQTGEHQISISVGPEGHSASWQGTVVCAAGGWQMPQDPASQVLQLPDEPTVAIEAAFPAVAFGATVALYLDGIVAAPKRFEMGSPIVAAACAHGHVIAVTATELIDQWIVGDARQVRRSLPEGYQVATVSGVTEECGFLISMIAATAPSVCLAEEIWLYNPESGQLFPLPGVRGRIMDPLTLTGSIRSFTLFATLTSEDWQWFSRFQPAKSGTITPIIGPCRLTYGNLPLAMISAQAFDPASYREQSRAHLRWGPGGVRLVDPQERELVSRQQLPLPPGDVRHAWLQDRTVTALIRVDEKHHYVVKADVPKDLFVPRPIVSNDWPIVPEWEIALSRWPLPDPELTEPLAKKWRRRMSDFTGFAQPRRTKMNDKDLLSGPARGIVRVSSSLRRGLGMFITRQGWVLVPTAAIGDQNAIVITWQDAKNAFHTTPAKLVGRGSELCVVVPMQPITPPALPAFANTAAMPKPGEHLRSVVLTSDGSAVLQSGITSRAADQGWLQTDITVPGGAGGAPVFDDNGTIVGLISLGTHLEGITFALAADVIPNMVESSLPDMKP